MYIDTAQSIEESKKPRKEALVNPNRFLQKAREHHRYPSSLSMLCTVEDTQRVARHCQLNAGSPGKRKYRYVLHGHSGCPCSPGLSLTEFREVRLLKRVVQGFSFIRSLKRLRLSAWRTQYRPAYEAIIGVKTDKLRASRTREL